VAAGDFAVFWEPGDVEKVLPPPRERSWRRIPTGQAPDGATAWSLYKEVAWSWPMLAAGDWALITAAIQLDGTIRFRTENAAGVMVICVGKTDQYPQVDKVRGVVSAPAITFAMVLEA
jgi:hypothetical protein